MATNDILINTAASYSLRRIETYSVNIVEKIVHTSILILIHIFNCRKYLLCYYISCSKSININELVTMRIFRQLVHTTSSVDRDSVSRLIRNDIGHVLAQHPPAEMIKRIMRKN